MRILVSHFSLGPKVSVSEFSEAWDVFRHALEGEGLATACSGLLHRQPESGYDTDEARGQGFMTTITFPDQAAADAAWDLMEAGTSEIARKHIAVIRKTRDAVFTFWNDGT